MSRYKVTHLYCAADWEALYIDNELVLQDHSIRISDALMCVSGLGEYDFVSKESSTDQVDNLGCYPDYLNDVLYV